MKTLKLFILGLLTILIVSPVFTVEAYVSVKGYYRSNGTYVAPHVRSNPNGLKYDNYSYKPSQGLYNKSYGTKGTEWDTPTYITDPYYYEGKSLYESGKTSNDTSTYFQLPDSPAKKKITIPANASLNYYGSGWDCNSGYKRNYTTDSCDKVIVPANATLNYYGSGWDCKSGYKRNYTTDSCDKVRIPANASLNYYGSGWDCNSGYKRNYTTDSCDKVKVPANATLNYYGSGWDCKSGYKRNYTTDSCDKVRIPANASLNYYGSGWDCNSGYKRNYTTDSCNKI